MDVLATSQKQKLGSDEVLVGTLITTSEKMARWDLALHMLGLHGAATNIICYNAALAACEKAAQWMWSLEIFQLALSSSLQPDATTFAALAASCRQRSKWQIGVWISEKAVSRHIIASGRALSLQADMACEAQASRTLCSRVAALCRTRQSDPSRLRPLQDPDEGTPKRLADLAGQLRTLGVSRRDQDRRFSQEVLRPVLAEMRALSGDRVGKVLQPGLTVAGSPNILSFVVSGLGAMERDALMQLRMPSRRLGGLGREFADSRRAKVDGFMP